MCERAKAYILGGMTRLEGDWVKLDQSGRGDGAQISSVEQMAECAETFSGDWGV